MTVVFIGGTNGLLSQMTVRMILAPVIKSKTISDAALSPRRLLDKNCSDGSGWKGFYDDLPESTQEP